MANYNKVILVGNLTRDPELKYTQGGSAVCEFGMAVNRTWKDQSGVQREETTFVDCNAWGRTGETINQYMSKGRPIFVEGRLKYDSWEAQDGSKRSKLRVVVETFQFLGGRGEGGGGGDPQGGGRPQQSRPPQQDRQPPARQAPPARPQEPSVQDSPPDDDFNLDDIPF
ncbi:MAG: single-stranded DNA-binding protein [Planctomycetota bacterium]